MAHFTVFEHHDAICGFFDWLFDNPDHRPLLETVGTSIIDIRSIPISDFDVQYNNASLIDSVSIAFGKWSFNFELTVVRPWQYPAKNYPLHNSLEVTVKYDGKWGFRDSVIVESMTGKVDTSIEEWTPESVMVDILNAPRRQASITLREHQKYLDNQAYYDILAKVLNIKPRKKKK